MASSLTKVSTSNGDALSNLIESLTAINGMAGNDTSAAKSLMTQLKGADYSSLVQNILNQATAQSTTLGARYANAVGASASGNSVLSTKLEDLIKQATTSATSAVTDAQLKNQQIQAQLAAIMAQAKAGDPALAKLLKTAKLSNELSKVFTNKSLADNVKNLLGVGDVSASGFTADMVSSGAGATDFLSPSSTLSYDTSAFSNLGSQGLSATDFLSGYLSDATNFGSTASDLVSAFGAGSGAALDAGTFGSAAYDALSLDSAVAGMADLGYGSLGMSAADMGAYAGSSYAAEGASVAADGMTAAGSALSSAIPIIGIMNAISGNMIFDGLFGSGGALDGVIRGIGNFFDGLF